jgi:hypothetical protein
MRRYLIALPVLIAALASACSSATHGGPAGRRVVVDDGRNGGTVTVHQGDTVVVRLHSTYWNVAAPPPGAVLTLVSRAVRAVPPNSGRCMPGMGCGTVVATFRAQHSGRVDVSASRTTCGEVVRCTKASSHYEVTLVVD